jgi:sugar lactone lactonase YvrE
LTPTSDAVPTCIAWGPDGALYVSELASAGNPAGSSSVWRFDPKSEDLDKWATGLTAVTGCGFGPDGKFYATEFSQQPFEQGGPFTGAVVRVPKGSTSPIIVADGLSFPNGFAATEDAIYVSNWSISIANPTGPPPGAPPGTPPPPPGSVVKISVGHGGDD